MKINKKILSFVLVLVLILSLSAPALAATITETYYYTVTKTGTTVEREVVSEVLTNHVQGSSDSIPYSISAKTYPFKQEQFLAEYRSQLMRAYALEGLPQSLRVDAESGHKIVLASRPTGTYSVYLKLTCAKGVWSVSTDGNATLRSGSFVSAPLSYTIAAELTN